jgi:hypothetical protein
VSNFGQLFRCAQDNLDAIERTALGSVSGVAASTRELIVRMPSLTATVRMKQATTSAATASAAVLRCQLWFPHPSPDAYEQR